MSPMVIKIVAVVILLVAIVVTALLTKTISIKRYQESENQKLNNAEDKARQIIDEAVYFFYDPGNNVKRIDNSNTIRKIAFSIVDIGIIHITNEIFYVFTFF